MENLETIVSIIVPVYNCEKYIQRCIESIQRQSYYNLEIIIVNDGSTDRSGAICDSLKETDDRIHVIHQDNLGVSAARNRGISIASGKYIQFVDSDDTLDEFMCEKLVDRQRKTGAELVICGYNLIEKGNRTPIEATDSDFGHIKDFCAEFPYYMENFLLHSPWNKLYIRDNIVKAFNEKYTIGEDLLFNIDYLNNCKSIAGIRDVLYNYYHVTPNCYRENGEENATSIYHVLKYFAVQRLDSNSAALLVIYKIYINDILYHISMASKEKNYAVIRAIIRKEDFQEAINASAKYMMKSYVLFYLNKFHLWVFLFLYFKIKNLIKG